MGEKTCKVPTPMEMVNHMLNKVGYTENLYGKKILENSCGEGNFLREIVRRYILDARRHMLSNTMIKTGLERDIHGIEKEEVVVKACLENLNSTAKKLGLEHVNWNIIQGDALSLELKPVYQFVVGNPPYITYYNLNEAERTQIKQKFETCEEGKADYYYAFTEAALRSLAPEGRMVYLIPNNFLKNRYSDALRRYILPYLIEVEDYTTRKVFSEYLTSSAVIFCEKSTRRKTFQYSDILNSKNLRISKDSIQGKWSFLIKKKPLHMPKKMGDCFQISAPVATLLNEAYILKDVQINCNGDFVVNDMVLEHKVIRPTASPKSMQRREKLYIIFPYWYDENGQLRRYEQSEFERKFPGVCRYLRTYDEKLKKRDCSKYCKWYEYGRSQALAHIDQPKLLLSTLITNRVKYYRLDKETVPYSGMYLVPKEGYTLDEAEKILENSDFYSYIENIGVNASGGSYRISPRDVCEYVFEGEG